MPVPPGYNSPEGKSKTWPEVDRRKSPVSDIQERIKQAETIARIETSVANLVKRADEDHDRIEVGFREIKDEVRKMGERLDSEISRVVEKIETQRDDIGTQEVKTKALFSRFAESYETRLLTLENDRARRLEADYDRKFKELWGDYTERQEEKAKHPHTFWGKLKTKLQDLSIVGIIAAIGVLAWWALTQFVVTNGGTMPNIPTP